MKVNDHVQRTLTYLERRYGVQAQISRTKKNHIRINWQLNGERYSVITSKTPSDWRTSQNLKCHIRNVMRVRTNQGVK